MHHASPFTIATALRYGTAVLQGVTEQPRRDTEQLLCAVLDCERAYLFARDEVVLDQSAQDLFKHYLQCRADGEPLAYIIGKRGFWTLLLTVNDSTLIPRADTETLVEQALTLCTVPAAHVLDLGTGSGAIALALASERPDWQIKAVDVQEAAVDLARLNRQQLGFANVKVYRSDWFAALDPGLRGSFDLIVSNPPYIDPVDPHLEQGDVRFEPRTALVAGEQGFAALFFIAQQARDFLKPGGYLLLEHGYQQGARLRQFLQDSGYADIATFTDFGDNERVTAARWLVNEVARE